MRRLTGLAGSRAVVTLLKLRFVSIEMLGCLFMCVASLADSLVAE